MIPDNEDAQELLRLLNQQKEMDDTPQFLHRPGDLPRKELIALANKTVAQAGGPKRCAVFFKFTCIWCGERCTLTEPNTLYESGKCHKCHKDTTITVGGLTIHLKIKA